MKKIYNLFLIYALLQSCASTTIIKVNDPNAQIYENDKLLGTGSAIYTNRALAWTSRRIKIQKDGCREQTYVLKRNEQLDVTALITGLLLIVPFAWIMKYDAVHNYNFECQN